MDYETHEDMDTDTLAMMAKSLRAMADNLDEILTKEEAGDDDSKYSSDGDVVEGRKLVGNTPDSKKSAMEKSLQIIIG